MARSAAAILLATFGLLASATSAEIYRWVDAQGNEHFSDVAPAGADVAPVPSAAGNDRVQTGSTALAPAPPLEPASGAPELVAAGPPAAWDWEGEMGGETFRLRIPAGWGEIPEDMLLDFEQRSGSTLSYRAGFRRWGGGELLAPFVVVAPELTGKLASSELAAVRRGAGKSNHADLEGELARRAGGRDEVEGFALGETNFDDETNTLRLRLSANGMEILSATTVTEVGKLNLIGFYEPSDIASDGPAFEALTASLELSPALVYQAEAGALDAEDERVGKAVGYIAAAVFLLLWLIASFFSGTARTALQVAAWVASLAALAWLVRNRDARLTAEASGAYFLVLFGFAVLRGLWRRLRGGPRAPAPLPGAAAGR